MIPFLLLGLAVGTVAGLIGIAGGVLLIPALVLLFHYPQKLAQGTTLAVLLPPIGLGAAYLYYKSGNVDVHAAIWIALGFFIGGFFGAYESSHLSNTVVQRAFGVLMLGVSLKLIFFTK